MKQLDLKMMRVPLSTTLRAAAPWAVAGLAYMLVLPPGAAMAQNQQWFVPGQQRPPAAAPRPQAPGRPAQPSSSQSTGQPTGSALLPDSGGPDDQAVPLAAQPQVQLPPAPEIPTLPKGQPPPAVIVGILSVPDVLRISTAFQQADRELGVRRQKLNEEAQKEQAALRDIGQALANDRGKMTPEQIRAKEREYQDKVASSRRKFEERGRTIQEAGQYVTLQIDRTLEQVAQQVAVSRGVNLVLNRAQILGITTDFDLTPQVGEVMNQILPSVVIPPDGVSPMSMTFAPPAAATPAGATPAAVSPAATPAAAAPAKTPPGPAPGKR